MKLNKLVIFALMFSPLYANAEDLKAVFDSANSEYSKGNYENAIKYYEQILSENKESSALYFNLGNAYFKTNKLSKAILNYERAKKLDPNDESIESNLKLANQKTEDKIEAAPQLFLSQWKSSIVDLMNEKQWSILLIVAIIGSLTCFVLYIASRPRWLKQSGFFGGSALMFFSVFLFLMARSKYNSTINSGSAIITSASVTVSGSPSEKGTRLFLLHEGTKVTVTEKGADWTEIKIANGNVGWIKTESLEEI
jgi:tetratricopeptide (TPR) repeat protein